MKNLKKFLVALVIVAMIVASIATVSIASAEEYTGTVDAARKLLDTVDSAKGDSGAALISAKAKALAAVSSYLDLTPVDPESEGYDELVADYNSWVAKLFLAYDLELKAAADYNANVDLYVGLYSDVEAIIPVGEDFAIPTKYVCLSCNKPYDVSKTLILLTKKHMCVSCEGGGNVVALDEGKILYEDFVDGIDKRVLDFASLMISSFYAKNEFFKDNVTYSDFLALKNSLAAVQKSVKKLSDVQPDSEVYTGKLAEAEALLNSIDAKSSYSDILGGLAKVYTYIVKTPVNPTSDAYLEFIRKYNSLCEVLSSKLGEALDAAATFDEKLAILAETYATLKGAEDDPATEASEAVLPATISESFVAIYNLAFQEFARTYEDYKNYADSITVIPDYVEENVNDVADPAKIIDSINLALANPVIAESYIENVIYPYIGSHQIDPASERYAEMIEKYGELVDSVLAPYKAALSETASYSERYEILKELRAYLVEYPISDKAIELYNNERSALRADVAVFFEEICSDEALPVYTAVSVLKGAKAATLNSLLEQIEEAKTVYDNAVAASGEAKLAADEAAAAYKLSLDKYNAALADFEGAEEIDKDAKKALVDAALLECDAAKASAEKAAADYAAKLSREALSLEAFKKETSILYTYIVGAGLDASASYFNDFKAKYNSLRASLTAALLRTVENAADADKKAAFDAVYAYLSETPLNYDAVVLYNSAAKAYNEMVAEYNANAENTVKLAEASLLNSVYYEINEAYDAFKEYPTVDAALKAELEALKTALLQLEAEVKELEETRAALEKQLEKLDADIAAKEAEIALEDDVQEKAALEAELAALNEEKTLKVEALAPVIPEIDEGKLALEKAKADIKTAEENIAKAYDAFLDAVEELAGYINSGLDVSDDAYNAYVAKLGEADEFMADYIAEAVNVSFAGGDMAATYTELIGYADFLKKANLEKAIGAYVDTVLEKAKQIRTVYNDFKADKNAIKEIKTISSVLEIYVDSYNTLKTFNEKGSVVIAMYDYYVASTKSLAKIYSDNAALIAEAKAIFDSFEAEFVAWIEAAETLEEKLEVAVSATYLLSKAPISQNAINVCNKLLVELNTYDFDALNEKIENSAATVVYAVPEGFTTDYSGIDTTDLFAAYKTLMCTEDGALIPFLADSDYIYMLNDYNQAKSAKANSYISSYNSFAYKLDSEGKQVLDTSESARAEMMKFLDNMHKELSENPTSRALIDVYVNLSNILFEGYNEELGLAGEDIDARLIKLHELLKAADFENKRFDKETKAIIENLNTKLAAVEYSSAFTQIDKHSNASGSDADSVKISVYNKLQTLKAVYSFSEEFTNKDLYDVLTVEVFEDYLDAFDKSIASLNDKAKEVRISILALQLEASDCPKSFVKLFEKKYEGVTITPYESTETLAEGDLAKLLEIVEGYYAAADADAKQDALVSLFAYVNAYTFKAEVLYDSFIESYEKIVEEAESATRRLKEALDQKAPISEYSLPIISNITHESGDVFISSITQTGATATVKTEANGNKYTHIQSSSWSPYATINTSKWDKSNGIVIEFRLMPIDNAGFEWGLIPTYEGASGGSRVTVFQMNDNVIPYEMKEYGIDPTQLSGYKSGVNPQIEIAKGEWTHFAIVINMAENEYELCVNYQSLGTKPLTPAGVTLANFANIRVNLCSNPKVKNVSFGIDDIKVYQGTAFRITDKFDGMSDVQKFEHFVSIFSDETAPAENRINAYNEATALLETEGIKASDKKAYEDFDYEAVVVECREESILALESLAAPLFEMDFNSANIGSAKSIVESARVYITKNAALLDQASDRFVAINEKLLEVDKEAIRIENLTQFVEALKKFHRAPTLDSLNRHNTTAESYYRLCELDNQSNLEKASADPLVAAFIALVAADEDVQNKLAGKEVTLANYHDYYINARIAERRLYENSEKFIECIEIIKLLGEEYDGDLEKAIKENPDKVSVYMVVLNKILTSGEYDKSFEGFEEAKLVYDFANDVFYAVLQDQYYEVIKNNFDKYAATDSYIEKAGICAYIENYIKENSVDTTTETGSKYLSILRMCQAELEIYVQDYATILNANTQQFIGLVKKMAAFSTYADLKPLYDEAINNYYYNMNGDSEEAKAAIAQFAIYEEKIQNWELNGMLLVEYAEKLADASRTTHKYRALVNCAKYIDKVDSGVEGVSEALELYAKKLAEYNKQIDAVNGEISTTVDTVCAVRSNSVAAAVLAVIKTIFGK